MRQRIYVALKKYITEVQMVYSIIEVMGIQYSEQESVFAKKWKYIPNTRDPACGVEVREEIRQFLVSRV